MENSIVLQKKQSVEKAIDLYESIVDKYNRRASRAFFVDISFTIVIPVIAVVLAGLFSNIAGLVTTLGLGTINAGEKLTKGHTLLIKYWSDRGKLEDTVNTLRLENIACEQDINKLNALLKKVTEYFEALKKSGAALPAT